MEFVGGGECRELRKENFKRSIKQDGEFKGNPELNLLNLFDKTHQPTLFNSTCRSNDEYRRNAIGHPQFRNDFVTTFDRYMALCDPTQKDILCYPLSTKRIREMEQEYKDTNTPMPPWRIDKTKPIGHNTLSNVMTNLSEICEFDEPLGGLSNKRGRKAPLCYENG
jgi:hypothetical protein